MTGRPDSEVEHQRRGAILLAIARASLAETLGGRDPDGDQDRRLHEPRDEPWLTELGASFVSLHRGEELRGCVGSIEAFRPLAEDVRRNAVAAALRDPRFPPLEVAELEDVELEVTLLSPPEPIRFTGEADALAQLCPGEDGLLLSWGGHRSTFLPQVWESLPTPEAFLSSLKRKAGLAPDFWHPDLELRRYSAIHWSESELRHRASPRPHTRKARALSTINNTP